MRYYVFATMPADLLSPRDQAIQSRVVLPLMVKTFGSTAAFAEVVKKDEPTKAEMVNFNELKNAAAIGVAALKVKLDEVEAKVVPDPDQPSTSLQTTAVAAKEQGKKAGKVVPDLITYVLAVASEGLVEPMRTITDFVYNLKDDDGQSLWPMDKR